MFKQHNIRFLLNSYAILLIRRQQISRTMWQLGIIRLAVLFILFLFVLAVAYAASRRMQNAAFVSGIWMFLISLLHVKRLDKIFLRINMNSPKWICGIEYMALSIPLIICLLMNTQWLMAICLILAVSGICFIENNTKKQRKTLNTRLQQYIPSLMYEWKAGIRQYFYTMVIIWLSGLCTAFFLTGIPIAMLIIGMLMFDFYRTNESWQMLVSSQENPRKLLCHKIIQHAMLFSMLVFPLIIVFLLFHFELWYVVVIEYIILLSIHIYSIVLKYAFYSHNRNAVNPVFLMTGIFIGLIPITTPLLWLFSIYFFLKARTNLYFYLRDYN